MNICSVDGCFKKCHGGGFCFKHYTQMRKHGRIFDRTCFDINEIVIKKSYAEVVLCDARHKEVGRAVVDINDVERIRGRRWRRNSGGYAESTWSGGSRPTIMPMTMHRMIMGLDDPKILVDHINRNGLDNRRSNLRLATSSENCYNKGSRLGSSSVFKGVCRFKKTKKWWAAMTVGGKKHYIGVFYNETEAALAYDRKAVELHGEFACLNFPFLW